MDKPKLNEPDVETTTTKPIIETQCTSCSKYPLKNYKINFKQQEEQDIFKEFEKLGYKLIRNEKRELHFEKGDTYLMVYNFGTIMYEKYSYGYSQKITFQEHQLLHRLFELWREFE